MAKGVLKRFSVHMLQILILLHTWFLVVAGLAADILFSPSSLEKSLYLAAYPPTHFHFISLLPLQILLQTPIHLHPHPEWFPSALRGLPPPLDPSPSVSFYQRGQ